MRDRIGQMPKAELHVHLGGSVPLYRLWEMGIARGIRGVGHNYEAFIQLFHRNTEATGDLYLSALVELGLILFLVTFIVNGIARVLVWNVTRRTGGVGRAA